MVASRRFVCSVALIVLSLGMRLDAAPVTGELLGKVQYAVCSATGLSGTQLTALDRTIQDGRPAYSWDGQAAFRGQINRVSEVVLRMVHVEEPDASVQSGIVKLVRPTETQLYHDLMMDVELSSQGDGCEVTAVHYVRVSETDGQVEVHGRVTPNMAEVDFIQFCNARLAERYFGLVPGTPQSDVARGLVQIDPVVNAAWIRVVAPSAIIATSFANRGYSAFDSGRYCESRDYFRRALIEAPDDDVYKYYVIVSEIALGDQTTAYRRLKPMIDRLRDPRDPLDYGVIVRALERVQGPLRMTLKDLEFRAMSELPVRRPVIAVPALRQ